MPFTPKTDWANSPSTSTPITAAELVRIEQGVAEGARDATETQKGNVELATAAEMTTGTDLTRVPSVKRVVDYVAGVVGTGGGTVPAASESVPGTVELATSTEMNTGTDLTRVPAVKRVADYVTAAVNALSATTTTALAGKANAVHNHDTDIDTAISDHLGSAGHLGLTTVLEVAQPVEVRASNVVVGTRPRINFVPGSNASFSVTDNVAANRVDVAVNAGTTVNVLPTTTKDIVMSFEGSVAQGDSMPIYFPRPAKLKSIRLTARLASTANDVVIDIDKLGTQVQTSIFTDTAARPRLKVGKTFEATAGRDVDFGANDLAIIQVINAGTNTADLGVILTVEERSDATYLDQLLNTGNGSSLSAVTFNNSASGDNNWSSINDPGNGTLDWDNTHSLTGFNRSMKVVAPASTEIQANWVFPNTKEVYGRVFFRKTAIETTGEIRLIRMREGGANKGGLGFTSNGFLFLFNGVGTIYATGTVPYSVTTWNRVEFRFVQGADGFGQAWLYKTETTNTADDYITASNANLSSTGFDEIQFGRIATTGGPYTFWLGGMAVGTRGKFGVM